MKRISFFFRVKTVRNLIGFFYKLTAKYSTNFQLWLKPQLAAVKHWIPNSYQAWPSERVGSECWSSRPVIPVMMVGPNYVRECVNVNNVCIVLVRMESLCCSVVVFWVLVTPLKCCCSLWRHFKLWMASGLDFHSVFVWRCDEQNGTLELISSNLLVLWCWLD